MKLRRTKKLCHFWATLYIDISLCKTVTTTTTTTTVNIYIYCALLRFVIRSAAKCFALCLSGTLLLIPKSFTSDYLNFGYVTISVAVSTY